MAGYPFAGQWGMHHMPRTRPVATAFGFPQERQLSPETEENSVRANFVGRVSGWPRVSET